MLILNFLEPALTFLLSSANSQISCNYQCRSKFSKPWKFSNLYVHLIFWQLWNSCNNFLSICSRLEITIPSVFLIANSTPEYGSLPSLRLDSGSIPNWRARIPHSAANPNSNLQLNCRLCPWEHSGLEICWIAFNYYCSLLIIDFRRLEQDLASTCCEKKIPAYGVI